jgi:predicted permease
VNLERWRYTIPLRLRRLLRRAQAERELDEELQFHLERQTADNIARGQSPEEARQAAIRQLNDMELRKEECRDMRGLNFIDHLVQDLRYGLRGLRKNPGFAILAVLVMALGTGANTAVFTVFNTVLLKPLAYRDPDRIVTLTSAWRRTGTRSSRVTLPDFVDWRAGSTAFSATAYYRKSERPVTLGESADYARVVRVSPDFFRVFGVSAFLGRVFSANDNGAGTAVLSYSYWQTRFGGSSAIINNPLRIDGRSFVIIGVAPPGFAFPDATDIWQWSDVVNRETSEPRSSLTYLIVARLKPEVSLDEAQTQLTVISERLEKQYPNSNEGRGVVVTRLRDDITGHIRLTLLMLFGAVSLLLLIACSNIATLLLARATIRSREVAIRAAIGAGRGRIVRQLLTESLLLALLAGAIGSIVAFAGSKALIALAPPDIPRLSEVGVDGRILLFTVLISGLASLLFGIAPAVYASRIDLNKTLKQGGARAVIAGAGRLRQVLVICEIGLSIVLLTGAGLLIRSFVALSNVELGFRPEHVLVMETSIPGSRAQAARFFRKLTSDIAGLPGVLGAGATMGIPGHVQSSGSYWIDRLPMALKIHPSDAVFSVITPGTFSVLQVPIKRGRDFNYSDIPGAPLTTVINEALAQKAFGSQDPIGRTIYAGFDTLKPTTIIGVVGDTRQTSADKPPAPEIFMPYEQHTDGAGTALRVIVKTTSTPEALEEVLRRMVRERSPDVAVKFTTMEKSLHEGIAAPRFRTLLIAIFACIALCLAMAGVYGVLSYEVNQRVNEIGLRMALGADTGAVLWMILRQGLALAAAGAGLGIITSIAITRLLSSLLFEVKANDPATYCGVILALSIVTLGACYVPASRAASVDPLVALRQE